MLDTGDEPIIGIKSREVTQDVHRDISAEWPRDALRLGQNNDVCHLNIVFFTVTAHYNTRTHS